MPAFDRRYARTARRLALAALVTSAFASSALGQEALSGSDAPSPFDAVDPAAPGESLDLTLPTEIAPAADAPGEDPARAALTLFDEGDVFGAVGRRTPINEIAGQRLRVRQGLIGEALGRIKAEILGDE